MSITIEQFKNGKFLTMKRQYAITMVLEFLENNKNEAFTCKEIAEKLNKRNDYISSILNKLKACELIEHKQPYWAFKSKEQKSGDEK